MGTPPRIKLDYQSVSDRKELLGSLSAITEANGFLWTASDEGHTLECLRPDGANRYCLKESYSLKHIFSGLKQEAGKAKPPEADIESLSVSDNKWLWICGSHCNVRPKTAGNSPPNSQIMSGSSRCLLGRVRTMVGTSSRQETTFLSTAPAACAIS